MLVEWVYAARVSSKISWAKPIFSTKWSGPEVIKLFSCSTQLSKKCILLINVKMPTSESFKARKIFIFHFFTFYEQLKFHAQLSMKSFMTSRPCPFHELDIQDLWFPCTIHCHPFLTKGSARIDTFTQTCWFIKWTFIKIDFQMLKKHGLKEACLVLPIWNTEKSSESII